MTVQESGKEPAQWRFNNGNFHVNNQNVGPYQYQKTGPYTAQLIIFESNIVRLTFNSTTLGTWVETEAGATVASGAFSNATPPASADWAPNSLSGRTVTQTVPNGTPETLQFTQNGDLKTYTSNGQPIGHWDYTRTGPQTANLSLEVDGAWTQISLYFTSYYGGNYSSPGGSGTFSTVNDVSLAPDSIMGRTFTCSITSGSGPFATSGSVYKMVVSSANNYQIVPMSGNVIPSEGTYTYTKTSATTAMFNGHDDSEIQSFVTEITFTNPTGGTFVITSLGTSQSGSFSAN